MYTGNLYLHDYEFNPTPGIPLIACHIIYEQLNWQGKMFMSYPAFVSEKDVQISYYGLFLPCYAKQEKVVPPSQDSTSSESAFFTE